MCLAVGGMFPCALSFLWAQVGTPKQLSQFILHPIGCRHPASELRLIYSRALAPTNDAYEGLIWLIWIN